MEIHDFSTNMLVVLFLVAIIAGFIDTLAGGGGLITMPALLISGIPPLAALGTNKAQGSVGTGMATFMMIKHNRIQWKEIRYLMLLALIGSVLGATAVQFIDLQILSYAIPVVLLLIAVYFILSPLPDEQPSTPFISKKLYQYTVIPVIGWYDGMFGPGAGSFFTLAGVSLRGHGLIDATAMAKALNFATNIASLTVFISVGQVVWIVGLTMMSGQLIGAWVGSHCLFKIKPKLLRILVVLMCLGMLIKYGMAM